ncbi:homoserine dehydrogenase [candidate division KSB1 bacterium]|nr:homoserine dehydrogenase [candidate division KSB1 bacterium]
MNLAFIGYGNVGQGLTEILLLKQQELEDYYGFSFSIVAVATLHKGSVYAEEGLDGGTLLNHIRAGGHLSTLTQGIKDFGVHDIIKNSNADVILELSYTDFKDGEPACAYVREALNCGKHVVTSNKGPSLFHHHEFSKLARDNHLVYGFEGTVMSGTPVVKTALKCLAGCRIDRIRGIWNGTTNFILSEMESGCSFQGAFDEARRRGYVEADAAADVDGWDATAKAIILANSVMGGHVTISDVVREGIAGIDATMVSQALQEQSRWKLVGDIIRTNHGFNVQVSPVKLPYADPLAQINGTANGLIFETDLLGSVSISGPGAGRIQTGYAILSDLLTIKHL